MEISCTICDDNLEITNKVYSKKEQDNVTESITSDVSLDASSLEEEDINNILTNEMHNVKLSSKNFNIDDIYKNPYFIKLTDNKKTLIINRVNDKISKLKTKLKPPSKSKLNSQQLDQNTTKDIYKKESYFYCKSCGYSTTIPSETLIFSRGNTNKYYTKNQDYYNDVSVYPRTKNYNCINKNCKTHKEPSIKNAVIHRVPGEYVINYKCNICDFTWNTFNES
jgi:hypothetical protein